MEDDGIEERVGESSWPSAAAADRGASSGGGGGYTDIRKEIFDRLMAKGIKEVVSDPSVFLQQLHRHFERLPARSARHLISLLTCICMLGTVDFHFPAIILAATPSIWTSTSRRTCCCTAGFSTSAPTTPTSAPSSMSAS